MRHSVKAECGEKKKRTRKDAQARKQKILDCGKRRKNNKNQDSEGEKTTSMEHEEIEKVANIRRARPNAHLVAV